MIKPYLGWNGLIKNTNIEYCMLRSNFNINTEYWILIVMNDLGECALCL